MEHKKSSQEMRPISAYLHQKRRDWEKKQKKFKNITNHNVPVLFASSDGLYLRLVDESGKFSCMTHIFYFITFLILMIMLISIHMLNDETLRIPKW